MDFATRTMRDLRLLGPVLLASFLLAQPAHALRVIDYNILNYPGSSGPARAPYYRTILSPLNADVIVTGEMASPTSVTEFLSEVLDVMEPGQWAAATFVDGNDTDAGFFYKPAKVQFLDQSSFYPDAPANLRLVHVYHVRPAGYTAAAADLWIYAMHLKASDTSADEFKRYTEAIGVRGQMEASLPVGARALILGDMNFYRATDRGYKKFIQDTLANIGRAYDLLPAGTWHDGAGFVTIHTQSPCLSGTCASGAATGGLDDRFDFILPTYSLVTGQGLAVVPGTCLVVGNDGQHFNKNITDAPVIPEGAAYATALQLASDHLPVRLDLQVPAEISANPALAFGPVIVGAPAPCLDLGVSNPALAPADSLNYSFAAPVGFTAPAGGFALAPGAPAAAHSICMSTASVGPRSGNLTINSDAVDDPAMTVALSGTVLDHAQASLDSLAAVTEDTLDFGSRLAGGFTPLLVEVHDLGYTALRARLSVSTATITGGGGRFRIAGFGPVLLADAGARWEVDFFARGATPDSTYEATLTFTSADEPLPGTAPQPDLHVLLAARVNSGDTTTAVQPELPTATRLYAPMPNPLVSGSTLRFDLARATGARLEIFDLSGRRVHTLADREFTPGRYSVSWDGRGGSGAPLGPGLYFVRLTTRGLAPQTVRLAVVR
jgi:hypothetical protein